MTDALQVAVLDHGMGNLRSVAKALEAAGASVSVTSDARAIAEADVLCVPGQGIFGRCMHALAERGLDDLIRSWIKQRRPFLGICLGMQVLFSSSDEDDVEGLGIFDGHVARLPSGVRVPHIGWNEVVATGHPGDDMESGTNALENGYFYFDHSYAVMSTDPAVVAGWCEHGVRFAAAIQTDSVLGVQFHPEKSGETGLGLLRRWMEGIARTRLSTTERRA